MHEHILQTRRENQKTQLLKVFELVSLGTEWEAYAHPLLHPAFSSIML
jgi:hypothetical protein